MKVLGTGSVLPGPKVDNAQLAFFLKQHCGDHIARKATAIGKCLGITSRHLARGLDTSLSFPKVSAPELSHQAIDKALGGIPKEKLTYLITHTATPHMLIPGNAAWVAKYMQLHIPYMELRQACTGFANALQIAQAMLATNGNDPLIAISGTEVGSVFFDISNDFIDTEQLVNYMQMGDAGTAIILGPDDCSGESVISDCFIGHLGLEEGPGFELVGGGSSQPVCEKKLPFFRHNPKAVKKNGFRLFEKGIAAISSLGYSPNEFDYIIPHQANGFIDEQLERYLDIPRHKVINDAKVYGNLGSAAIWNSFDRLRRSNLLSKGSKVLILGAEATQYMYGGFVYTH